MIALLYLLACGGEATPDAAPEPAPAEAPAPKKGGDPWSGAWTNGDKALAMEGGELRLVDGSDTVMSGTLEGKGRKRTAALDGCGATLEMRAPGGPMKVDLDGPECPIEWIGTYKPAK